jgi:hypothetical protein
MRIIANKYSVLTIQMQLITIYNFLVNKNFLEDYELWIWIANVFWPSSPLNYNYFWISGINQVNPVAVKESIDNGKRSGLKSKI